MNGPRKVRLAPVKHLLNFDQDERSEPNGHVTRLKSKRSLERVKIDFNELRVIESEDSKILDTENNKPMNTQRLIEQAEAIVNEAIFIGIVRKECKRNFMRIARVNFHCLYDLRDIFKIEKDSLVKRYDSLLRNNKLVELDQAEYEKLYKAKYLVAPKGKQKQL